MKQPSTCRPLIKARPRLLAMSANSIGLTNSCPAAACCSTARLRTPKDNLKRTEKNPRHSNGYVHYFARIAAIGWVGDVPAKALDCRTIPGAGVLHRQSIAGCGAERAHDLARGAPSGRLAVDWRSALS